MSYQKVNFVTTAAFPLFNPSRLPFDGIGKSQDGYKLKWDKSQIMELMEGYSLFGKKGLIESQVDFVEERLMNLVREDKKY